MRLSSPASFGAASTGFDEVNAIEYFRFSFPPLFNYIEEFKRRPSTDSERLVGYAMTWIV